MANIPYIESLMGGFAAAQKKSLKAIFEYILGNLRFGRVLDKDRAENLQLYFFQVTTPTSANEEFTVPHTLRAAPYTLIPVLNLQSEGDKLVELEVSQVADDKRIYLKSPVTSAEITIAVEA